MHKMTVNALLVLSLFALALLASPAWAGYECYSNPDGTTTCVSTNTTYCTPSSDTTSPQFPGIQLDPVVVAANSFTQIATNAMDPESGMWGRSSGVGGCRLELIAADGSSVPASGDSNGPSWTIDAAFNWATCEGKLYLNDNGPEIAWGHGTYTLKITVYNGAGTSCEHTGTTKQTQIVYVEPVGCEDKDHDGFNTCQRDCNDNSNTVYPGAPETCNNVDDDCNSVVDDNIANAPLCENQLGACQGSTKTCTGGSWLACTQASFSNPSTNPNANKYSPTENACDNFDNNCNGQVDEAISQQCQPDINYLPVNGCTYGTKTCHNGQWTACTGYIGPSASNNYCGMGGSQGYCGDNVIQSTEQCEGANLAGKTCALLGFTGGSLSCNAQTCRYNIASCTNATAQNTTNTTSTLAPSIVSIIAPAVTQTVGWFSPTFSFSGTLTGANYSITPIGKSNIMIPLPGNANNVSAPPVVLKNGNYQITFTAKNGNKTNTTTRAFVVNDLTAPDLTGVSPTQGQTVGSNTFNIQATINEPANVTYAINNGTETVCFARDNIIGPTEAASCSITLSNGAYTLTLRARDFNNNVRTQNISFTVNYVAPPPSDRRGGGGGSPGPAAGSSSSSTKYFNFVNVSKPNTWSINSTLIPVSNLSFGVSEDKKEVDITIKKNKTKAPDLDKKVYEYFTVDHPKLNNSQITGANITFKVKKTFILGNNLSKEDIALFRFNTDVNSWQQLSTSYLSSDADYHYYIAQSPGFSEFAVSAVAGGASGSVGTPVKNPDVMLPPPGPVPNASAPSPQPAPAPVVDAPDPEPTKPAPVANDTMMVQPKPKSDSKLFVGIGIMVLILVGGLLAYFVVTMRSPSSSDSMLMPSFEMPEQKPKSKEKAAKPLIVAKPAPAKLRTPEPLPAVKPKPAFWNRSAPAAASARPVAVKSSLPKPGLFRKVSKPASDDQFGLKLKELEADNKRLEKMLKDLDKDLRL